MLFAIIAVLALVAGSASAQQVPIPQTAAEVSSPAPGPLTKAYVQMVGRMAYVWGWPLGGAGDEWMYARKTANQGRTGILLRVKASSPP